LLLETCGEIPTEGARIQVGHCTFVVLSVTAHRIGDLIVEIDSLENPTDAPPISPDALTKLPQAIQEEGQT